MKYSERNMTCGTSHLLIGVCVGRGGGGGGGGGDSVVGTRKILLCKMCKGGIFCQLSPVGKKDRNAKNAQTCKKLSNIEQIFLARFAHSGFYKIHISGAANRHALVQYAKYDFFFLIFF